MATNIVAEVTRASELQQQLIGLASEMIGGAKEAGGAAIAWLQNVTPELVSQILNWHLACALVWIAVGVIIMATVFILSYRKGGWNSQLKEFMKHNDAAIMGYVGIWVGKLVGFLFIIFNLFTILKITFAPYIFIIEYAGKIVAGNGP